MSVKTHYVIPGQTLADVAVLAFGYLESMGAIALANGLDLTDDLTPGAELILPELKAQRPKVKAENSMAGAIKTHYVIPGQTLADVAVLVFGYLDSMGAIALANGLDLTQDLTPGAALVLPELKRAVVTDRPGNEAVLQQRYATVKPSQTLPDIAIQYCGTLASMAEIAVLNGLQMTAALTAGQVLLIPAAADKRTVLYFLNGGYNPAVTSLASVLEGIDYWAIELEFIVL